MHEAVFHRLDDPFFGPKGPAPGHAVDTVLEEAELGPSASNDIGLTCINLANSKNLSVSRIIKKNNVSVGTKSFSV